MHEDEYRELVELYWQGKAKIPGEKHVPVPLYPTRLSHRLNWNGTRDSAGQKTEVTGIIFSFSSYRAVNAIYVGCKTIS